MNVKGMVSEKVSGGIYDFIARKERILAAIKWKSESFPPGDAAYS